MIAALLIAVSAVAAPAPAAAAATHAPASAPSVPLSPTLADTAHAIDVGRLEQAQIMISAMVAQGAKGPQVDRLVADVNFATGRYAEALALYQQLLVGRPNDSYLCERAGIAALKLKDVRNASRLIDCATAATNASWRAWNAQGVVADMKSDWSAADAAFERAAALAPDSAEVLNNRGWSQLMRGNWEQAEQLLAEAAAGHAKSERVANNLELARAALATDLPQRVQGESDQDWAARLNDVGVASAIRGDQKKAVAAFTQALQASGTWYERAANNLKVAGAGQ
ncbi:Flp pilus assembly protein TadD [Sphingomonas sp. F9_3S_D5_B_2]